jgi:hypothetical protein
MTRRSFVLLAAVGLLTALVILHRQSGATEGDKSPRAPETRIAFVNIGFVLKNNVAYRIANQGADRVEADHDRRVQEKRCQVQGLCWDVENRTLTAEERADLERTIRETMAEMERLKDEGRETIVPMRDEARVTFYRDLQDAAQHYAAVHGFELVLHFNDPLPPDPNYYSALSVQRRVPLVFEPSRFHPVWTSACRYRRLSARGAHQRAREGTSGWEESLTDGRRKEAWHDAQDRHPGTADHRSDR